MMARHQRMLSLALAFTFLAASASPAWAQQKDKGQSDPGSRERNVKTEKRNYYKEWLEKDVPYIITDDEKRAFKKLVSDDEREQFIDIFWHKRDPDPDTDENEYKDEYYERIAYANEHFASGIPGWKSDRGRIYIMFGPPHEKESHPSGGTYDRESTEGGGTTSTYPFEKWFYRYLPGVGSGVEIEFVDPTGSGEYRIARSPNEKDALLNVPGAGLTTSEELGLSSKADRISGASSIGYSGPGARESDSPFTRLQLLSDLQKAPPIVGASENGLTVTGTGATEDSALDFDARVDFFRQSDDRVITAITIQTDNDNLTFKDAGGIQQARLNITGRVTSVAGRRVTSFEDPVTTSATVEELASAKTRKSIYQKALPLPPGTYKVDVLVRDVNKGTQHSQPIGFTVPKFEPNKLATSTMVLAVKLQTLGEQLPGMFSIGGFKVIPNVAGTYKRGQDVGIYMQVYNAGIDQTTLRPSVDVEYALLKDGKEILKQAEDWRGLSDGGQRLTLARLLPTSMLAPGQYEITIRVRDRVSGQSLAPTSKFTITADKEK